MKYYVITEKDGDEFTEGKFNSLKEAIEAARAAYARLTVSERARQTIEVRQYAAEDIEDPDCDNLNYDTFEWMVTIPGLSADEVEAVKWLYDRLDMDILSANEDCNHSYLTVYAARNGRDVVWYMDTVKNGAVYVDTLQELDEDEIEQQLI